MKASLRGACCTLLAFVLIFGLCGCGASYEGAPEEIGTSCGNIMMGNGKFACGDGFLYFTDMSNLYEYDLESKKTIVLRSEMLGARYLYLQDSYVYFADGGLRRISRDGKRVQTVFRREGGCERLFVQGNRAYYLDGVDGTLFCRELKSGEERALLENVMAYFVDGASIYAAAKRDGVPELWVAETDTLDFEKRELTFAPIAVFASERGILLSQQGTYRLVLVTPEGETELPISSVYYQMLGGDVIYLDESDRRDGGEFALSLYRLDTGEKRVICGSAFDFNLLEDRYLCIQSGTGGNAAFLLYDLTTGTTETMWDEGS